MSEAITVPLKIRYEAVADRIGDGLQEEQQSCECGDRSSEDLFCREA